MRDLFNKVSNPLMLSKTLDCIAADTNYMNIIHIFMYNTGSKIVITDNCKMQYQYQNFQSSAKFMHGKNQKTSLVHLHRNLVETFALILNSKIFFKTF